MNAFYMQHNGTLSPPQKKPDTNESSLYDSIDGTFLKWWQACPGMDAVQWLTLERCDGERSEEEDAANLPLTPLGRGYTGTSRWACLLSWYLYYLCISVY